jgi:ABC-2 type transport system permease protein
MAFWTLYRREAGSYFISPVAYVVFFATAIGIGSYFNFVFNYFNDFGIRQYTVLQACVNTFFFWLTLMVQVPIITMRVFSEEFKMGTIEMLLTAPVEEWEVVLSKFFGALTFFVTLWIPLLFNLVLLSTFSNPHVPIFWKPTGNTFLLVLLIGTFYVSIGVFTSVLTKNQIIAAILSFALIFLTFSISFIPFLNVTGNVRDLLGYFSALEQMDTFSKGVFDSRPVIFYLSATVFLLLLTQRLLEARRLKS